MNIEQIKRNLTQLDDSQHNYLLALSLEFKQLGFELHFSEWAEINREGYGPSNVNTNILVFEHPQLKIQRYLLSDSLDSRPDSPGYSVRHQHDNGGYIWLRSHVSFLDAVDVIRRSLGLRES